MAIEFDDIPATGFQSRRDIIRAIYERDLGRDDSGDDEEGIEYWNQRTDLQGDDLLREIRSVAGLDNTLYEDPVYSAFDRRARMQALTVNANRLKGQQDIDRQTRLSSLRYDETRDDALEQVNRNSEGRGMFQSGGRIADRADAARSVERSRQDTALSALTARRDLDQGADEKLADLSRQRDEQEVASRQRLTQQSIVANQRAEQAAL